MEEMIRPHDFEEAKDHIQTFANNTSACTDLEKVSTNGGLFGWFDHTVTGAELNKVTGQVQDHLVRINELQKSFIAEFGQVYKALESLDSEYIKGILIAVKGAQESSDQAKKASEKAQKAQSDISKTIEGQKKVISILADHKKKLETIKHLDNIDEIWNDLVDAKEVLDEMINTVEGFQALVEKEKMAVYAAIAEKEKEIISAKEQIEEILRFRDKLQIQQHLDDIDLLWSRAEESTDDIKEISESIELLSKQDETMHNEIASVEASLKPVLDLEHIYEVDNIWEISNNNNQSIIEIKNVIDTNNTSVLAVQEKQSEFLNEVSQNAKENQSMIDALMLKVKISYGITAILAGIEIVHIIVGIFN